MDKKQQSNQWGVSTPHGEVVSGRSTTIKIHSVPRSNEVFLDVRLYALSTETNEFIPTRKGLHLRPTVWKELLPLISEALKTLPSHASRVIRSNRVTAAPEEKE